MSNTFDGIPSNACCPDEGSCISAPP